MSVLMLGKGFATVLGAVLMVLSQEVLGTDLAQYSDHLFSAGEFLSGFGLLRKGVVDWNWFGTIKK